MITPTTPPPDLIPTFGKGIIVQSVHAAFVREQLAAQFAQHCLDLCPACRGEQPDAEPKPVRVDDWALERNVHIAAYVHTLAGGHRVLCGANALRMAEDARQVTQPELPTAKDWETAAKQGAARFKARREARAAR